MPTVKFMDWNCKLHFRKYENGRTAIQLEDAETGEPIAIATVNIPECDLKENQVIIKDWSENEGMLKALVDAGIVENTGKTAMTGFVTANICNLLINQ